MTDIIDFLKTYGWILLVLLFFVPTFLYFNKENKNYTNCLTEYAEKYCHENNLYFTELDNFQSIFYCKSDFDRKTGYNSIQFYFKKEELEFCRGYK